jgi:hypothetical protein
MLNFTFKKGSFLLLVIVLLFTQKMMYASIPGLVKTKKLIVIIPDENSKALNNMMDAVQDHWKYGEYKFMNIKDAEQLYNNIDYLFLALVTVSSDYKSQSGTFNLTLKKGKIFARKDFNNLGPVYTQTLISSGGTFYGSSDNIPETLSKQLYFYTSEFILRLKYPEAEYKATKQNGVKYLCKKAELEDTKNIISQKKVLLIEKTTEISSDSVNREAVIRNNLNNPGLEIIYVDYEEIELAVKKKDPNVMVAVNWIVFSCSDFEDLCYLPAFTKKEQVNTAKMAVAIMGGGFIVLGGFVYGFVTLMHKIL